MPADRSPLAALARLILIDNRNLIRRGWSDAIAARVADGGSIYGGAVAQSKIPEMADEALRLAYGDDYPADWDSRPGRTQADVLGIFDMAIGRLS